LSPTFRAAIALFDKSLSQLHEALDAVGAGDLLASISPRSFSEEHCEVFFSMCTRKAHVAQTPEEYGFATAANRQFEAFRAGHVGIHAPQPTGFYRELKSRSTMSPFITLHLPRRTKVAGKGTDLLRIYEAAMRRFRELFAARDRVQRVRRSFHTSRLGVKPRSMQLMFAPVESIKDFKFDRQREHAAALEKGAARESLRKGEIIEARKGAVVAVIAGCKEERYWFLRLDENIVRNESAWVTKKMSGVFLERDTSPHTYVHGDRAVLAIGCLIAEVDVEFNTDDPTLTRIEISPEAFDQLDREVAEITRDREDTGDGVPAPEGADDGASWDGAETSRSGRRRKRPSSLQDYC